MRPWGWGPGLRGPVSLADKAEPARGHVRTQRGSLPPVSPEENPRQCLDVGPPALKTGRKSPPLVSAAVSVVGCPGCARSAKGQAGGAGSLPGWGTGLVPSAPMWPGVGALPQSGQGAVGTGWALGATGAGRISAPHLLASLLSLSVPCGPVGRWHPPYLLLRDRWQH